MRCVTARRWPWLACVLVLGPTVNASLADEVAPAVVVPRPADDAQAVSRALNLPAAAPATTAAPSLVAEAARALGLPQHGLRGEATAAVAAARPARSPSVESAAAALGLPMAAHATLPAQGERDPVATARVLALLEAPSRVPVLPDRSQARWLLGLATPAGPGHAGATAAVAMAPAPLARLIDGGEDHTGVPTTRLAVDDAAPAGPEALALADVNQVAAIPPPPPPTGPADDRLEWQRPVAGQRPREPEAAPARWVEQALVDGQRPDDIAGAAPAARLGGKAVVAIADDALDGVRGGFVGDGGLRISFGIERAVYINGQLVTTTSLNLSELGTLAAGKGAAAALPAAVGASVALIQSGAGNTVLSNLGPAAIGTVIQNTLNGQTIQSVTTINATVNSLSVMRSQALQSNLRDAIVNSLRR